MKKTTILGISALLGLVLLSGCIGNESKATGNFTGTEVLQYKDPECGCCVSHASYLSGHGFDVTKQPTENMASIKAQYNIPANMESCHTEIIEGYFVEGHVPIEAINKLLEEKPDIDGIAIPGMPAGSPGMPGTKKGPFIVYAIKNGQVSEFTRV